jgi:hypothetical protein
VPATEASTNRSDLHLKNLISDTRTLGWEHTEGCTLYEHREEVEKMCGKDVLSTDEPRN